MADSWLITLTGCMVSSPAAMPILGASSATQTKVHPGNQLAGSARKVWCVYMSFVQFGKHLSKSELWWTVMVKRSEDVSKLQASIGQLFRIILEKHFWRECIGASKQWTVAEKRGQDLQVIF